MRNSDKTPAGLARLAEKSRQAAADTSDEGERGAHERVAADLEQMAQQARLNGAH